MRQLCVVIMKRHNTAVVLCATCNLKITDVQAALATPYAVIHLITYACSSNTAMTRAISVFYAAAKSPPWIYNLIVRGSAIDNDIIQRYLTHGAQHARPVCVHATSTDHRFNLAGLYKHAMVGLTAKVSHAIDSAIILTLRVVQFNANPLARIVKVRLSKEPHSAGEATVQVHSPVHDIDLRARTRGARGAVRTPFRGRLLATASCC